MNEQCVYAYIRYILAIRRNVPKEPHHRVLFLHIPIYISIEGVRTVRKISPRKSVKRSLCLGGGAQLGVEGANRRMYMYRGQRRSEGRSQPHIILYIHARINQAAIYTRVETQLLQYKTYTLLDTLR